MLFRYPQGLVGSTSSPLVSHKIAQGLQPAALLAEAEELLTTAAQGNSVSLHIM
jgi:hypothetical protein